MENKLDLIRLFNKVLPLKELEGDSFSCVEIPDFPEYLLAKNKDNLPSLLIKTGDEKLFSDIGLENLSVLFNRKCSFQLEKKPKSDFFTIVNLTHHSSDLNSTFLLLLAVTIEHIGRNPSEKRIYSELLRFAELFKIASNAPLKSIQGLWGELFVIENSIQVENFIHGWHLNTNDKLDFYFENESIEVKSSTVRRRTHYFSIEQLHVLKNQNHHVASVFVERLNGGCSIDNLIKLIEEKLSNEELIFKLKTTVIKTLGNDAEKALTIPFNYDLAKESLIFIDHHRVPKIKKRNIPREIKEVKLKIDLTGVLEKYGKKGLKDSMKKLF